MELKSAKENGKLTVFVSGRVDTTTAPELDAYITENLGDAGELVLDLNDMSYTSSAGLRVFLKLQKLINSKQGTMTVKNVQSEVMEVFEITGFNSILTIE